MAKSPKDNEEKLDQILNAWKTLAADKSFGGMTAEQFETAIAPSKTSRARIDDLNNQITHAINEREAADEVSLAKGAMVVAGVVGDPNFGDDSSLYETMGYTRKSERKSGLTRKKDPVPPPLPKT
jgi:hypothetical protein